MNEPQVYSFETPITQAEVGKEVGYENKRTGRRRNNGRNNNNRESRRKTITIVERAGGGKGRGVIDIKKEVRDQ